MKEKKKITKGIKIILCAKKDKTTILYSIKIIESYYLQTNSIIFANGKIEKSMNLEIYNVCI